MAFTRAAHARNLVGPIIRSTYRITCVNAESVSHQGSLMVLCDWNNIAAPAVLKAALPRPVHVWADGPAGVPGPLLSVTGDLAMPVTRLGVDVVSRVAQMLDEGEAVAALGVGDLGYVLARSGAPVLPVHVYAPTTKRPTDPPARKADISVVVGNLQPFPHYLKRAPVTRANARDAGEWARQVLVDSARESAREMEPHHDE